MDRVKAVPALLLAERLWSDTGLLRSSSAKSIGKAKATCPSAWPVQITCCTQDLLEPLHHGLSCSAPPPVRAPLRAHNLQSFTAQADDSLAVQLLDKRTQRSATVHAKFVFACDGGHSTVRRLYQVPFLGPSPGPPPDAQCQQLNLYFRCDLRSLVGSHAFSLLNIRSAHPALPLGRALFASINHRDRWVLQVPVPNGSANWGEVERNYPETICLAMIRAAILGSADALPSGPLPPITLLGRLPWRAHTRLAGTYRPRRRVFLLGDAAHLNPPWGGFGATTGVADAQNLSWKVAAVLAGQVGNADALLDTYEAERREQARFVGRVAVSLNDDVGLQPYGPWGQLMKVLLWAPQLDKVLGVGYGYSGPAVYRQLRGDGSKVESSWLGPGSSRLCGEPGTRVPHVELLQPWPQVAVGAPLDDISAEAASDCTSSPLTADLAKEGPITEADLRQRMQRRALVAASRSSLDVCRGPGLTLLAGPEAEALVEAVTRQAQQLSVPVRVFRAGQQIHYKSHQSFVVAALLHQDLRQYLRGDGGSGKARSFWPPVFGTERDGGLLVRPDGFIAGSCVTTRSSSCSAMQAADRWARSCMEHIYARS